MTCDLCTSGQKHWSLGMGQGVPDVAADAAQNLYTNYVGLACFTVLIWDHMITFANEVNYVWNSEKSVFVIIFFIIRYFTPCLFIINLGAYFSPFWAGICNTFIRYEGVATAVSVELVGVMMLIRVWVLYQKKFLVAIVLVTILAFETGVNIWLITRGEAVLHNPYSGVHACTMIFDPSISAAAASSAWIPLLYDSIVFLLTAYKAAQEPKSGFIVKKIFAGGLFYYCVIFVVTLILTVMIIAAPPGLKNITAQSEQLMTVAMMSRITIDLKKAGKIRKQVAYLDLYTD